MKYLGQKAVTFLSVYLLWKWI